MKKKISRNRVGTFFISQLFFRRGDFENIQKILAEVVVIRAEYVPRLARFEYVAISSHFDEVREGETPGKYQVLLEVRNGVSRIFFNKVDLVLTSAF